MKQEGPPLAALLRRLADCPAEFLEPPWINGAGTIRVAAVVNDLLRELNATPPLASDAQHNEWAGYMDTLAAFAPGQPPRVPPPPPGEVVRSKSTSSSASLPELQQPSFAERLLSRLVRTAQPPAQSGSAPSPAAPAKPAPASEANRLQTVLILCWLLGDPWFRSAALTRGQVLVVLEKTARELAASTPADRFIRDPDRREECTRLVLAALYLRPQGETPAQAQDRLANLNTAERLRVLAQVKAAEERARQVREELARKAAEEAAARYNRE